MKFNNRNRNAISFILFLILIILGFNYPAYSAGTGISPGNSVNTGVSNPVVSPGNSVNTSNSPGTLQNPLKSNLNSVGSLLNTGIMIFTYLVVLGAVVAFIIVGLKYILARGNPAEITKATSWLWHIIIGVAIVIGARVIIQVVISTLESTGVVKTEITQSAKDALSGQRLNP